jgi:peptidyl-prolyl cis-trans isomerase C
VDDQEQAERILASLKASRNRNFGELARLHSKAATAADGGDMGQFQRGELPMEFERVVSRLQPGSVSRIVRTRYGYHMFMVEERIGAHQQKFYEVREQIHDKLVAERQMDIIRKELSELQRRIPVEIYSESLGFKYVGKKLAPGGEVN